MDEGQDRVKASYRGNYDRLTQVKERYDPANAFHINQNIQPASGPGRRARRPGTRKRPARHRRDSPAVSAAWVR